MKRTVCRWLCLGLFFLPMPLLAGSGKYRIALVSEPYTRECSGCHIAYQPALLPARAWQNIMSDLDRHYGTDASLDAELVQQLSIWLQDNAGRGRRFDAAPPEDRITKTGWFYRKHRRIDPSVWRLESVKSAANCEACHAKAEQGRFDDDSLILPEGSNAAQMRSFSESGGKHGKHYRNKKHRFHY